MRTTGIVGAAFVLWFASLPAASAQDGWHTDFETALAEARRLDKPLLIHFYADWCAPCRQMERDVLHRRDVLRQLGRSVVAVKINVDRNPAVASRYSVEALPSDVFVEPNGRRLMESSGYRSANEYVVAMTRAETRYADLLAARRPAASEQDGAAQDVPARVAAEEEQGPMLDGYCPVTLWRNRRWVEGSRRFRVEHRDQIYQMADAEAYEAFRENPSRYAPRFLGCDPIVVWESDRAVPGSTRYGAFYDDELYLFVTDDNRQLFKQAPDRYIRTRVVLRTDQIEQVVR